MIDAINTEKAVEKEIQLKKRTIMKIMGRSDYGEGRGLGIDLPTQFPSDSITTTSKLPPTVGTFK